MGIDVLSLLRRATAPADDSTGMAVEAVVGPARNARAIDKGGEPAGGPAPVGDASWPVGQPLADPPPARQLPLDLPAPSPTRLDSSKWVLRSDARGRLGWEPPDVPDAERWWVDLPAVDEPMPGVVTMGDAPSFPADGARVAPCPRCGSLELWWDLLGQPHCQHCDHTGLARARRLREHANLLRQLAAP